MRLWSIIVAALALVTVLTSGGFGAGVLFGRQMTEKAFCRDADSARYITDDALRARVCRR